MGGIPTKRQVPETVTKNELSGTPYRGFYCTSRVLVLLFLQTRGCNLKGAYLLSELAGQNDAVIKRIPLLIGII